MKKITTYILLFIVFSLLINCNKYEITSREYPRIKILPVTDITSEGVTFNAEIIFRGGFEIINYGFVWGLGDDLTLKEHDRVIYAENVLTDTFTGATDFTLKNGSSYSVKAFVETSDFIVYSDATSFVSKGSKGPELLEFFPKQGTWGDTIVLKSKYLGKNHFNVKAKVNKVEVDVFNFKDTEVSILVPYWLKENEASIALGVANNYSFYEDPFILSRPKIDNINPSDVTFGSIIEIRGDNFSEQPTDITASLIDADGVSFSAEVISSTKNLIEVKVPNSLTIKEFTVTISINDYKVISEQVLRIKDPVITSFTPDSGKSNIEVRILGENFSEDPSQNIVKFDGARCPVLSATNNELVIQVPNQFNYFYNNRQAKFTVDVLSTVSESNELFTVTDKWLQIDSDLPYRLWSTINSFALNGKGYVLTEGYGIWEFDPNTRQWTILTEYPEEYISNSSSFVISDKVYLIGGESSEFPNRVLEYDITNNLWTQKEDFPGEKRPSPISFSIGNYGYFGLGFFYNQQDLFTDVWRYDPITDSWNQMSDIPIDVSGYDSYTNLTSIELNNEEYVTIGLEGTTSSDINLYKYNPSIDQWTLIPGYPLAQNRNTGLLFGLNNQIYTSSSIYNSDLWTYDGSIWKKVEGPNSVVDVSDFTFIINNVVYIGSDSRLWEFDSSQPD